MEQTPLLPGLNSHAPWLATPCAQIQLQTATALEVCEPCVAIVHATWVCGQHAHGCSIVVWVRGPQNPPVVVLTRTKPSPTGS